MGEDEVQDQNGRIGNSHIAVSSAEVGKEVAAQQVKDVRNSPTTSLQDSDKQLSTQTAVVAPPEMDVNE